MKKALLIVFAGLIAISCGSHRNANKLTTIELKQNLMDTILAEQVFKSVDVITLDLPDSILMGYPSKIIQEGDNIYTSDGTGIFVFNSEGQYIRPISRKGRGPGEHQGILDFTVDGDNVYLIDSSQKLMKYAIDGHFVNSQSIGFFAATIQPLGKGKLVVTSAYQDKGDKFRLFSEATLKETSSYCPVNEAEMKYRQLLCQNSSFVYDGSLLFHERWNSDVYRLEDDGYNIIYHFDFFGRSIPESFLQAQYSDVVDFSMKLKDKNYCYLLNDYAESDKKILMCMQDNGKTYMCLYDKKSRTSIQFSYIKLKPDSPAFGIGTIPANFYSEESMFFSLGEGGNDSDFQICKVRLK